MRVHVWIRAAKQTSVILIFLERRCVVSHPPSEMWDISENVINNFGTSMLDIKLGPPSGAANCRVALQVGRVSEKCSLYLVN